MGPRTLPVSRCRAARPAGRDSATPSEAAAWVPGVTPKDKEGPTCATALAFREAGTAQTRRRPYAPAASGARPAPPASASLFRVSMVPTSTARHSSRDFGGAAMARS